MAKRNMKSGPLLDGDPGEMWHYNCYLYRGVDENKADLRLWAQLRPMAGCNCVSSLRDGRKPPVRFDNYPRACKGLSNIDHCGAQYATLGTHHDGEKFRSRIWRLKTEGT
jgi:hypothetical protein